MIKKFFTVKEVMHWHRLAREAVPPWKYEREGRIGPRASWSSGRFPAHGRVDDPQSAFQTKPFYDSVNSYSTG